MDVQYFIDKFEAIPEDMWCTGNLLNAKGQQCANGLCGVRTMKEIVEFRGVSFTKFHVTDEAKALTAIFADTILHAEDGRLLNLESANPGYCLAAAVINNGNTAEYRQDTPKQRILAALRDIQTKEQQDKAVEEAKEVLSTPRVFNECLV